MKWYWPAIFVFLAIGVFFPPVVGAQEPEVRVSSSGPYPLLIEGFEVTDFPASVPVGTLVCASSDPLYISDVERINFQRWSHGAADLCTTFDKPGDFTAIHEVEVLLTINSQVREFRETKWVTKNVPILLTVPAEVVERPGVRYRFEEWTLGETRFNPQNRFVPNRPLSLEVRWTKEYFLELLGPEDIRLVGQGWYQAGTSVVIQADSSSSETDVDTRFEFRDWEIISNPVIVIPNRMTFQTTIRMDNTHVIRANFHVTFNVVVANPAGELKNEWVPEGDQVTVDTPSIIVREEEKERLRFTGWEGADIELAKDTIKVTGPMHVKAKYETQFMVTVEAKYGVTGDGWYTEGEVATIEVPQTPSAGFFIFNRSFLGFDGYPTERPVLELTVDGAVTVTAAYQTGVDYRTLGIIIGALVAVGLVYLVTQRELNRRRRSVRW